MTNFGFSPSLFSATHSKYACVLPSSTASLPSTMTISPYFPCSSRNRRENAVVFGRPKMNLKSTRSVGQSDLA
jgi:hypothetical protein